MKSTTMKLTFHPLDKTRWKDFETLFGERGACGGCWCMSWRSSKSEFEKNKGAGNRQKMKQLVKAGEPIGIIAYARQQPIAWCAVAPREKYIRLEHSRVLKRFDDESVWSIPCFFIAKEFRRKGLSVEILKWVITYCRRKDVKILEAYPIYPYASNMPAAFAWTGFVSSFTKAGFRIAKKWSNARPIMRYFI
jgi:GNAT superfamily N-acetyltransferase